jgi:Na+/H+ antiporter NhaD/arsenite permease-like protein
MNNQTLRLTWFVVVLAAIGVFLVFSPFAPATESAQPGTMALITGKVTDKQNQPVAGATVALTNADQSHYVTEATSQANGTYTLFLSASEQSDLPDNGIITIDRAHFETTRIALDSAALASLRAQESVVLPDTVLSHEIDAAFWIATAIFLTMLILIATSILHNTLAALVGTTLVFGVSYLGEALSENLYIFDFERALSYVDWNVIFLIMGMMIVIAVVERTGIFQWLAFMAYRGAHGRMWVLVLILMLVTSVASALLDNVTTMLLMTPITVQIALALGINPLALLMPEVMVSNVAGISTLIGTPTNILIGSYATISFNDFLVNLTPGVVLAFMGLLLYNQFIYRRDLRAADNVSPVLLQKLEERARITQPDHLKKAGWVGAGMLVLFIFGEHVHLLPAVTALMGATLLLVWIKPDIEEMIEAVDWTTLVFFITLFIVVGAIQEVGLISIIADEIAALVGTNLILAILIVIWASALFSTVVANIPFTAAMLPVIGYLTATVPDAESKVLFYCLSVGSAMGGNGSLIGASANMITAGIAERAGFPITYAYFLKHGFPALLLTVSLATIWIVLRFLVL